ncbi:MAG: hypothetical protein V1881_03520 [Candidatus Micrarchaeota archaeon]
MKPAYHLVFAVAVIFVLLALFVPAEMSWQVLLVAGLGGMLPDFEHREWLWKLVVLAAFAGSFLLLLGILEQPMGWDAAATVAIAAATAAVISFVLYKTRPIRAKGMETPGSGFAFVLVYTFAVFAASGSQVLALVALVAYSSHWVLDYLAYQTTPGRRFLMGWPHPEKPFEWHYGRLHRGKE